ncbi:MAG: deoxyribodipyrimidine photo-lyase [Ferruginibacter sp.]|nr:deoxyribodipyrimidine photo-lyase [Ferruginibacter sp.]
MQQVNICWFRRDLRFQDNAALYHAFKAGLPVLPLFIFDKNILDNLEDPADSRVTFIHQQLEKLQDILLKKGSTFEVYHEQPDVVFKDLIERYPIHSVFTNEDYEPYATDRDEKIAAILKEKNRALNKYKDHVILAKDEVLKDDGKPYTVFTPFSRKWKSILTHFHLKSYPSEEKMRLFLQQPPQPIPSLKKLGFSKGKMAFPDDDIEENIISHYGANRDFPGIHGTSHLGLHLRFGTISIRQVATKAMQLSAVFLSELIWRDFYQMILWHFPQVGRGRAFKPAYEQIEWRIDNGEFEKWCSGQTGYPIVDAGMRELNATGFMHNRVRMITASFLCKHLLLDWRLGEAYFAEKLLDYDLAANNGGWQWAAGSGCDAAPYFRIFNPYLQTKKFDPDFRYIKKWVPEFQEFNYAAPIVDHDFARKRCLQVYSAALKKD